MSSNDDKPKHQSLDQFFSSDTSQKTEGKFDDAFSRVEQDLIYYKSKLHTERFCWTITFVILLDVIFFEKVSTWPVPITICIFELILVTIIANRLGIKEVTIILFKVIDSWAGKKEK